MIRQTCGIAAAATLIALSAPALADLAEYSQDFEALVPSDGAALSGDGWLVFGNVFTPDGDYIRGYGTDPAPNGDSGFSGIVDDQGGDEQGANQLNVYSDYGNVGDHSAGNVVESNVFQEQVVGAADVGSIWMFRFDAKRGNIEAPSTALAFIKTLNPMDFSLSNFITEDTSAIPATWGTYILSIAVDASLVGHILQIGFANTATMFQPSAVFYDNVVFSSDLDGDGAANNADNCQLVANAGQQDSNVDGFGNRCDPDITGPGGIEDCAVNFLDLNAMKAAFFSNPASPSWNPDADLDSSGLINFTDLNIVKGSFFGKPGPSSSATCP